MIIGIGIILILLGVFLIIGIALDDVENNGSFFRIVFGFPSAATLIGLGIAILVTPEKPSALDVYRDKTELQVNYKVIRNDTVPTDSIVIWKSL